MSNWDQSSKHRRSRVAHCSSVLDTELRRAEREPSKADLKAMLAEAAKNTAEISTGNDAAGSKARKIA
jgi:hypothetical protein